MEKLSITSFKLTIITQIFYRVVSIFDVRNQFFTAAWLAQLVGRQSAVREIEGSSPGPDQHSGS